MAQNKKGLALTSPNRAQTQPEGYQPAAQRQLINDFAGWMRGIGRVPRHIQSTLDILHRFHDTDAGLTKASVEHWLEQFQNPATRAVNLSALRKFADFCFARGELKTNPLKAIKISVPTSHRRKAKFTGAEVRKLLAAIKDPFWTFAITASHRHGLSLSEICLLEWDSIPAELDALASHIPVEHDRYLFPAQRKIILDSKSRAALSVQFSRLCQRAGLKTKKSFRSLHK